MTDQTFCTDEELKNPLARQCALSVRKRVKQIAPYSRERSLIAWLLFSLEDPACLFGRKASINRNGRLFFGEQNPVAIFPRQLAPGTIDVVTKCHQNIP